MTYNNVVADGEFEWDDEKNELNKKKHSGLGFETAKEVFDDKFAVERFDEVNSSVEEPRYRALGRIKSQIVVVLVHTQRNGRKRLISARYATSCERRFYYENFRNQQDY